MAETAVVTGTDESPLAVVVGDLRDLGVEKVLSFAWRDLDDPDAGGSEVHADHVMSRWAAAGLGVTHRTSRRGQSTRVDRNGYRIVHRGGRYTVFLRVVLSRVVRRAPRNAAILEIWNGVPWFTPLWASGTRAVWLHHIHDEMWGESVPRLLAPIARFVERRIAPLFYRRTIVVTLADPTREALIERGFAPDLVRVVPPGINPRFRALDEPKSPAPLLVAVGRLTPVKRFEFLIRQFAQLRVSIPDCTLMIIGDGPDRERLEQVRDEVGLRDSVVLCGRLDDDALVRAYNRAWLLVSASHSEGWGMTITEAAACGTPAVVTDNHGHRAAVVDGSTGVIVPEADGMSAAVSALLSDRERLETMSRNAREHSRRYDWDTTALRTLEVLLEARRRQRL